jgi:uncharacterized repeat protein (TIGR01451 family)
VKKRFLALSLLAALSLLLGSATPHVRAQATTVPVTVSIYKLIEIDNPDSGKPFSVAGDFYAKVSINGSPYIKSSVASIDPGFLEGVIYSLPVTFKLFWTFTVDVDSSLASVPIDIQIWDEDNPGFPLFDDDDQVDVNPAGGKRNINLDFSPQSNTWSGDLPANQTFAEGGGDSDRAKIFFDISARSATGDADGDGLLDGWETNGLDADGDGTMDVNLPAMGANPNHKDLFLELDFRSGQTPNRAGIQAMKAAFAAAPINAGGVNNPDGQPGINLWVDTGGLFDPTARETGAGAGSCNDGIDNDGDTRIDAADTDCQAGDNFGGGNALPAGTPQICNVNAITFYNAKNANFNRNRSMVFRYGISEQGCDQDADGNIDSGGWGEIGGNDFVEYNHDGGTIMHEFGHTLNLHHGGNVDNNCKPNYVSVMNYDDQFAINQAGGGTILDYSPPRFAGGRGAVPAVNLVENNLNEATIIDGTDATNRFVFTNLGGNKVQNPTNARADWNGDGDTNDNPLTVNIDTSDVNGNPGGCTNSATNSTLKPFDDWTNIALAFRQFGDSDLGAINPVTDPEPNLVELQQLQTSLSTTNVGVTITDAPDPVAAGTQLVYSVTANNLGPNPASQTQAVVTLPAGVAYQTDTAGCVEAPAGTLTCNLGEILAGQNKQFSVTVLVNADLVYNNGGPQTITGSASVSNLAGPDSDSSNNSASTQTQVVAVADLDIVSFAAVNPPAEMIIGTPLNLTLRKTITNHGPSTPMDVTLSKTAAASAGASVSPATSTAQEQALAKDEQRQVDEAFTLQCSLPGPHTFTFTNGIAPKQAADTDPDLSNNQKQVALTIDCVVPVAVNIKPHSFPNSVSLTADGVVPLSVLTTRAGEYGLPLAFDATKIDPLSARFGPRSAAWSNTAQATEVHNTGHLEDSYELDDKTRDKDTDMTLHFGTPQSGLIVSDTEACVKGQFLAAGGVRYKFFGCDSVLMRP